MPQVDSIIVERNIYSFFLDELEPRNPTVDLKRAKPLTTDVSFFEIGVTLGKLLVVAVRSNFLSTKVKVFEATDRIKGEKSSGIFKRNSKDKSSALKLWKVSLSAMNSNNF